MANNQKERLSPKEWRAQKEAETKAYLKELETGVKDVFKSGRYAEYLDAMSRFHDYSFGNTMMIFKQMPEATYVAGYNDWLNKFERQVNKGEHGIAISAPIKRTVDKLDNRGNVVIGADGSPEKEDLVFFKRVYVFDVSQTDGKPLPTLAVKLEGNAENYSRIMTALREMSPAPIKFEAIGGSANGYYDNATGEIVVRDGMSEQQTLKTAIHEIAHAILHDRDNGTEREADKSTREVQAESIAYIVSKRYGVDTSEYSFGYVAGWGDKDFSELKKSLTIIQKTADTIIKKTDEKMITPEQKIEQTSPKKTTAPAPKNQTREYDNQRDFEAERKEKMNALSAEARSANLAEYFARNGYTINNVHGEIYIKEIPGLVVNPTSGKWYSHYSKEGGSNSVDCLTKIVGTDFKTAVEQLTGKSFSDAVRDKNFTPPREENRKPPDRTAPLKTAENPLVMPEKAQNCRRVIAYMTKTRKIPIETVLTMIKADRLYQDTRGNAVFPHFKNGKAIGAEIQGTLSEKRYKGIAKGTGDSVVYVQLSKELKKAMIFESSIDMMSCMSKLNIAKCKEDGIALISMGGLKPTVPCALREHGIEVISCVDNDEKGKEFEKLNGFARDEFTIENVDKNGLKDWNDVLKSESEKSLEVKNLPDSPPDFERDNDREVDIEMSD